jgi:peptidoglycan hydrolase-like protein with peptidoglycan-binding domain
MPHVGVHLRRIVIIGCSTLIAAPVLEVEASAPSPHTAHAAHTVRAAETVLPQRGERSELVRRLQALLIAAGVRVPGGADGLYGKGTASAVSVFQQAKGLPVTGVVDLATATAVGLVAATPQLAQGSTGSAVQQLQQRLQAAGIRVPGGADGVFGPATAKAVAAFQTARKLPVTGTVDAYTAAVIHSQVTAPPAAPPTPAAPSLPTVGSSGPAVTALQRQLIAVGARPAGGADGVYGAATKKSVALFQRWMGLKVTGLLDQATVDALSSAAGAAPTVTPLAAFPLPTTCSFWDTWGAPRSGGRRHEGTDIFAKRGTPVYAVAEGRITRLRTDYPGSRGGNQFWLTAKDGTKYFYGHLDGFAKGIGLGVPVRAGDVIGYAGKTGLTTVVHLHFEVHPGGGKAVNPYPILRKTAGC